MPMPNKPHIPVYRLLIIFLFIALLLVAVIGWLRSGEAPAPPITEHDFDKGHVEWTIEGYPTKALHNNLFSLMLTDRNGVPLRGATLEIKLDMLNMVCGDYVFSLEEISPGLYTGEGVPLMAGMWKATLTLVSEDQTYTLVRHLQAIH